MAKQQRTIGISIVQIALSIYLIITGICLAFPNVGSSISSAEIQALTKLIPQGTVVKVIDIILGVILGVGGILLFIKAVTSAFNKDNKGVDFGKVDDCLRYIIICLWIIITVVALVTYAKTDFSEPRLLLHWFLSLAKNALIVGGLLTIKNGN